MGLTQKYRKGDRFIAKLVDVLEDEKGTRYVLDLGGIKADYTKEELVAMEYVPVYESTGELENAGFGIKRFAEGYLCGYEAAKRDVMKALGIRDEAYGYKRAKRDVIEALEE